MKRKDLWFMDIPDKFPARKGAVCPPHRHGQPSRRNDSAAGSAP